MTNLLVSLLDKVGVPMDTLGDSTGRIESSDEGSHAKGLIARRNPLQRPPCGAAAVRPALAASAARLVEAVKAGDKAAVATLLKQKADVNAAEPDGTTALHWAVRQDDPELTDRLLRAGADVKAANRYGITALYLASLNGNAAIIERLLKAGADANAAVTKAKRR